MQKTGIFKDISLSNYRYFRNHWKTTAEEQRDYSCVYLLVLMKVVLNG